MVAIVPIALLGALVSALGLLAGWVYLARLQRPKVACNGRVTLILPLTGAAQGLESLLRALECQTLAPRRLLICVEASRDPAYQRALDLAAGSPLTIEVILAGEASRCAQKCTNQLAGLSRIDERDDAIVLFDADILPPPWWLSALASPILDGSADVVNGYRWPMVEAPRLGAHLAAAIDRGIALMPRFARLLATWGGSIALSPLSLGRLNVQSILGETLSDDSALGAAVWAAGLRVLTRRALLVPTPRGDGPVPVWRFGRRQYQIVHIYRPELWWLAFLAMGTRLFAWGGLGACLAQTWARWAFAAMIGMAVAGVLIQRRVGQRLGFPDPPAVTALQIALALLRPLVDLFHWTAIAAAAFTRRVRWGHVDYRVSSPTGIAIASRAPWA